MQTVGTGIRGPKGVNSLGLSFNIYRKVEKEEIRFILVDSAQEFLKIINAKN